MIEVQVAHLGLDQSTNSPVVLLKERDGERVLPIWIGPAEASAIAMEMQGVKAQRPMTHDLLKHVILGLGGELRGSGSCPSGSGPPRRAPSPWKCRG